MTATPEDARVWVDEEGYIQYSAEKGSLTELVLDWLSSDIQGSAYDLVHLLDAIERRRTGNSDLPFELSGNAWTALITKDQVKIENKYVEQFADTVSMDIALDVLRAYWNAFDEAALLEAQQEFAADEHRTPQLPW